MLSLISKLTRNDLERDPALIILGVILFSYIAISGLMWQPESEECLYYGYHDTGFQTGLCGDYLKRQAELKEFDSLDFFGDVRHWFSYNAISFYGDILVNQQIIPFAVANLLLVLIYFTTRNITGLNYPGLIAVTIVLVSPLFHKYDSSSTYPVFWVALWLASISLMTLKKPAWTSGFVWWLAITAKIFNLLMLPVNMVFLLKSELDQKTKRIVIIYYGSIIAVISFGVVFFLPELLATIQFHFQPLEFLWWLGMWSVEFVNDRVSLYLFFICIPGLFFLKNNKVPYASAILLSLLIMMIQPALISGFTDFTNEEYRLLPMVVFTGIGISMIVCNFDKVMLEVQRFQGMMKLRK